MLIYIQPTNRQINTFFSFIFHFRILVLANFAVPVLIKQMQQNRYVVTKTQIHPQLRQLQFLILQLLALPQFKLSAWHWQFLAVSWWHSIFSRTCKIQNLHYHSGHLMSLGSKEAWANCPANASNKIKTFNNSWHVPHRSRKKNSKQKTSRDWNRHRLFSHQNNTEEKMFGWYFNQLSFC